MMGVEKDGHGKCHSNVDPLAIRAAAAVIILAMLSLAAACGFAEGKKEAEQLADQYFLKMQAGDVEGALTFYSPRFYKATSRTEWLAFLQDQRTRCGAPKSHSLTTWNVFSSIGSSAGTRTTLVYDVQYTSCRMSEKITVFKPDDGKTQIDGHFLKPEAGKQEGKGDSETTLKT
jgi:hypothetical protein